MKLHLCNKYHLTLSSFLLSCLFAASLLAQQQQTNTGESPLFRGEQLLINGSYAAAADIFQMADGLDRNEGIVGASKAFFMMGNTQEAINIIEQVIEDDDYASYPLLSTQLAEVKRSIGQSAEAIEILSVLIEGQFEPPVRALVQYGSLLRFVGRKAEAGEYLDRAVQRTTMVWCLLRKMWLWWHWRVGY